MHGDHTVGFIAQVTNQYLGCHMVLPGHNELKMDFGWILCIEMSWGGVFQKRLWALKSKSS